VVEDKDLVRTLLTEALSDAGYEVTEAWSGDRALIMLAASDTFDLVLTDISMPGRADGNAVAARAKLAFPGMPVVYVSARPDSLTNEIGCHDVFIQKPFNLNSLVNIVGALVSNQ
jgi:DNA-binding response OmpR family regulator